MPRDSFLQSAFDVVCQDAKPAEGFYVCLMRDSSYYGGPEEGGWWGHDVDVVAYQYFETQEAAEAARVEVEKLARELADESRKAFGEQCLRETAWLEARGLDDSFLPEVDGEDTYSVIVSEGIPEKSRGCRHYE